MSFFFFFSLAIEYSYYIFVWYFPFSHIVHCLCHYDLTAMGFDPKCWSEILNMTMILFHLITLYILLSPNSNSELFGQGFLWNCEEGGGSLLFQYFLLVSDEKLLLHFQICMFKISLVNSLMCFPENKMQTYLFVAFLSLQKERKLHIWDHLHWKTHIMKLLKYSNLTVWCKFVDPIQTV